MKSLIEDKKLKGFYEHLSSINLSQKERNDINFLIRFLRGRTNPKLSNKTFLFYGDPGIGKSFLVEKILDLLKGIKIVYIGCADLKNKNIIKCQDLDSVYENLRKTRECIVFIDDLRYVANYEDGEIADYERKSLMKILEHVKKSSDRTIFISTLNSLDLDEAMCDRVEVKIQMDLPSHDNRAAFVQNNYSKYVPKKFIDYLNKNLIGYNYRDIPEVLKIAYREGKGRITKKSIKTALQFHKPSSMMSYPITRGVELKLSDVVGRNDVKKALTNLKNVLNKPELTKKFGLKRCNIILFHGPNGTGKSYMARALAGELEYSLMEYSARYLYRYGPLEGVYNLVSMAKRFKNCVIFVDESEKMFNRRAMELDEDCVMGELNRMIEGAGEKPIESVMILAANNLQRFPKSFLDRVITVKFELPDYSERVNFIKKMLENVDSEEFDIIPEELASMTENFSFRDLEKIWRDAAQSAVYDNMKVTMKNFREVLEKRNSKTEEADYLG